MKNEEKNQRCRARQAEDAEREEKKRKLNESRQAKATSYVPASEPPAGSTVTEASSSSTAQKMGPDGPQSYASKLKQKRTDEAADAEENDGKKEPGPRFVWTSSPGRIKEKSQHETRD